MKLLISQFCAWAPSLDSVERWRDWAINNTPLGADVKPPNHSVPAMTRRRLTLWGRMSLEVASSCAPYIDEDTPCVFASRHGDTRRTLTLLQALSESEALSPTAFSLSVHNSSAGVFSIVQKMVSPSVALAAGKETLGQALIEANGLLSQGHNKVLLVLVDEPIADFYQNDADEQEIPYALAMVINASEGQAVEFTFSKKTEESVVSDVSMGLSFLKFWFNSEGDVAEKAGCNMKYVGNRSVWCVNRAC